MFTVCVARVDELIKRQQYGELVVSNEKARALLEEFLNVPETTVSTNEIILPMQDASTLSITNKCSKDKAAFEILCEVQSSSKDNEHSSEIPLKSPFGFPCWLKVCLTVMVKRYLFHLKYCSCQSPCQFFFMISSIKFVSSIMHSEYTSILFLA